MNEINLLQDLFAADPCLYWDQLQLPNSGGRHWKFDARFHLYSSSHFQVGLRRNSNDTLVHTGVSTILFNWKGFFFLLDVAIYCRMERLNLREITSQAKSLGTVVAITGAMVMTLYQGPTLFGSTDSESTQPNLESTQQSLLSQNSNWVLGGSLITLTCLMSSGWNILQVMWGIIAIHHICPKKCFDFDFMPITKKCFDFVATG